MKATRGTTTNTNAGSAIEGRPDEGMRRPTGRERSEWFALLDEWGAAGRPYREIAAWLTGTHDLTDWWAQKVIVEYEEARGLRPPGIRRDGSFEVGASKTIAVSLTRLYAAFMDPASRARWLTDADLRERSAEPERSARFDWQDGSTRVVVTFEAKGDHRSQVAIQHQRIADAASAEHLKTYWRERLVHLKAFLEGKS